MSPANVTNQGKLMNVQLLVAALAQVERMSLAFGGMAPVTKACVQTAQGLCGRYIRTLYFMW